MTPTAPFPTHLTLEAEEAMRLYFPSPGEAPSPVRDAMEYSLFAGGKRFRPILCLLGAQSLGMPRRAVYPLAAAIEYIHTYSLIHDDLPALDNDDFRRGRPTCHKVFGEATAIMAGDALLTEAFRIVALEQKCSSPVLTGPLLSAMAAAAGVRGMVGGQGLDRAAERESAADLELLRKIHLGKTARLIGFSVSAPAIVNGEPDEVTSALRSFGEHLGIAFQIVDDILDEIGTVESLGKTPGSDRRQGKTTYVSLRGLSRARQDAQEEKSAALAALTAATVAREQSGRSPLSGRGLADLASFVIERTS